MLLKAIKNLVPNKADRLQELWNVNSAWSGNLTYIGWNKNPITGETLTEEDIYYCSIAWRCMMLIGGTVSSLPRFLYRVLPNGGCEKATSHPNYRVISVYPNEEQTWAQYDYMRVLRYYMYGNSYDQKLINARGDVVALNPLHPARMEVCRDPVDYRLIYKYTDKKGTTHELERKEVHHIAAPSVDGILGISTCAIAQRAIQLCKDFDEFTARFLHNDATPPFVFVTDQLLKTGKADEILAVWESRVGGLRNKHRAGGVLDAGLKPVMMNVMSNREAELGERMERNASEICRYFGVQEHKVGLLKRSTNNNIDVQSDEYLLDTASPVLTIFQQAKERDFLKPVDRTRFFVEYDVAQLRWANAAAKAESDRADVLAGIMAPNEARADRKLNPHSDPVADALLIPTANAPNGKIIAAPVPDATPADTPKEKKPAEKKPKAALELDEMKAALIPLFEDAAARCCKREIEALEATVKRVASGKPASEAWAFMKTFYQGHLESIRSAFRAPVAAGLKLGLPDANVDQELFLIQMANRLVEESVEQLHGIAAKGFTDQMIMKSHQLIAARELNELVKLAGVNDAG